MFVFVIVAHPLSFVVCLFVCSYLLLSSCHQHRLLRSEQAVQQRTARLRRPAAQVKDGATAAVRNGGYKKTRVNNKSYTNEYNEQRGTKDEYNSSKTVRELGDGFVFF